MSDDDPDWLLVVLGFVVGFVFGIVTTAIVSWFVIVRLTGR